jgi:chromosome segregation ATPase
MKNAFYVFLGVLIVALALASYVSYQKYIATQAVIDTRDETISKLNAEIVKLNEERASLQEKLRTDEQHAEMLERGTKRIAELKDMIKSKDLAMTELEEKIDKLERAANQEKGTQEALKTAISARDARIAELQTKLNECQSQMRSLGKM